jgi:hypothetical protein
MNKIIAGVFAFLASSTLCAQLPVYNPDWFQKYNPDYIQRTSKFYKFKYMPSAAATLAKAANSPALPEGKAAELLSEYIDNYLQLHWDSNGSLTRADVEVLTASFDKKVKDLVKNDAAYQKYLKWRNTTSRDDNALEFLFHTSFALPVNLRKDLVTAGWTVQSITDIKDLGQYEVHASFAPDQALIFKNAKLMDSTLTVLVYPTERIRLMQAGKGPNSKGKLGQELRPFWQVSGYSMYTLQPKLNTAQSELADNLRTQWIGH